MGGDLEKRGWRGWFVRPAAPRVYRPGPFAVVYAALLVAGVGGAVGVYFLLLAVVPGAGINRLDVAKTALLVVGGSGAVAGLYVTYRKQRTDEANHVRDQDKLFTERYTQAVAQLGNLSAAVRLGGVYALARIADDSERDRSVCLRVLCAYLRMPYNPDLDVADKAEPEVRAAAQTVLAERLQETHPGFWKHAEIDLRGARLVDLDFTGVTIDRLLMAKASHIGFTEFDGATFTSFAGFSDVAFSAGVRFDGATFQGDARFDRATFQGDARFDGARFYGHAEFGEAIFHKHAVFGKPGIWNNPDMFNGATFASKVTFDGVQFHGRADFGGARFNPSRRPTWPDGFEPVDIEWATEA